jgi:hypothetical protein
VFLIGLCAIYLTATEFITAKKSKGEVLLFRRGHSVLKKKASSDEEIASSSVAGLEKGTHVDASAIIKKQTAIFHWEDVCYDIKIKGEPRRILDNVDGWVKPGTLTALMVRFSSSVLRPMLTTDREFLALVKPLCLTYWQLERRWESSQEECLLMAESAIHHSNARQVGS